MSRKRTVIVGTSFAGCTGALELHRLLGSEHDIVVVAKSHDFVFIPIWYPCGLRDEKDISFDVRPIYAARGIKFVEAAATGFDLDKRQVLTDTAGPIDYDYLHPSDAPGNLCGRRRGLRGSGRRYARCMRRAEDRLSIRGHGEDGGRKHRGGDPRRDGASLDAVLLATRGHGKV